MASSRSNEEKSSKRKVDATNNEEKKKKNKKSSNSKEDARERTINNLVNAITAKETTVTQTWKRVIADLDKAGIDVNEKDVREGEIMWEWHNDIYIKLGMKFSPVSDSKDLVPNYEVYSRLDGMGKTKVFEASEWDRLVEHLFASKKQAKHKANCKHIVDYLDSETDAWKELIDAINEYEDVPPFSDYEIEDGLITLDWTCEDKGFKVSVQRRTQDSGDGDVYDTFWVQKSPLKQNDASITKSVKHYLSASEALERVAELLE